MLENTFKTKVTYKTDDYILIETACLNSTEKAGSSDVVQDTLCRSLRSSSGWQLVKYLGSVCQESQWQCPSNLWKPLFWLLS